jgi:hypothetical protein
VNPIFRPVNNPDLKDEIFDATVRFHVVWTELRP